MNAEVEFLILMGLFLFVLAMVGFGIAVKYIIPMMG